MEPTKQLADELFLDKVRAAKRVPADEGMAMVLELSRSVIDRVTQGVREQFPAYTPEQVLMEVRRRFDIARKIENHPMIL